MVGGINTHTITLHPHISLASLEVLVMVALAPWLCQGGSTAPSTVVPRRGSTAPSTIPTTVIYLDTVVVGHGTGSSTTMER